MKVHSRPPKLKWDYASKQILCFHIISVLKDIGGIKDNKIIKTKLKTPEIDKILELYTKTLPLQASLGRACSQPTSRRPLAITQQIRWALDVQSNRVLAKKHPTGLLLRERYRTIFDSLGFQIAK